MSQAELSLAGWRRAAGAALAAAALAMAGPAQAGPPRPPAPSSSSEVPLPRRKAPQPVEAVKSCSLGGGTFTGVQVPGTNTCVKAGGFVRWQGGGSSR